MPKLSGESMRTIRTALAKPAPGREIKHGWPASGGKTFASEMGSWKWADHLKPSPPKKGPAGDGKVDPRQMRY